MYSLRPHNPEVYVHYEGKEKTPKEMKEAVIRSERLQRVMEQASTRGSGGGSDERGVVYAVVCMHSGSCSFMLQQIHTTQVVGWWLVCSCIERDSES